MTDLIEAPGAVTITRLAGTVPTGTPVDIVA